MAAFSSTPMEHDSVNKRFGLPLLPEIVEIIFWHMDAGTFFIALQTCRQFAEAGSTRKNLLHQIGRIPGGQPCWESDIGNLGNEALRRRCCQHAATSGCMAWILADIRRRSLPSGTILSKSAFSAYTPVQPSFSGSQQSYMALANGNGTITIHSLAYDDVRSIMILDLLASSPHNWTKIHALAFSRKGDLIVLHGRGSTICQRRVKEKDQSLGVDPESEDSGRFAEIFELTTFYRCFEDSMVRRRETRRTQIVAKDGGEPMSIALACNGDACIAWKIRDKENFHNYDIHLARVTDRLKESLDPRDDYGTTYPRLSIERLYLTAENPESCSPMSMQFAEKERLFLMSGGSLPLYVCFSRCGENDNLSGTVLFDQVHIDQVGGQRVRRDNFRIGTPFYRRHAPDHPKRLRVRASCYSTYLALAILNTSSSYLEPEQHLYVLMQQETSDSTNCRRRANFDRIFLRDTWTAVALLAGWRCSRSSVGSLLETTPQGNRIASAYWDRIMVWTIHPDELCQMNPEVYFPARDYNAKKRLGRIRPVLLPPQGVVHAMKWIDQDMLFALTDKGLVSWNVGPQASGQRSIDEGTDKWIAWCPSYTHMDGTTLRCFS